MRASLPSWCVVLVVLIGSLASSALAAEPDGPASPPPPAPRDRFLEPAGREWLKENEGGRAGETARPEHVSRTDNCPHDFDVLHYRLDLIVDIDAQLISGTTLVRFVPEMEALDHIDLDLAVLTVSGVTMNGQPLSFVHNDPLLSIDLGGAYGPADTLEVAVTYQGHPGNEGPAGFGGFYFDSTAHIGYQMGVGLVADPPSMGKYWFPCWDAPCDKATAEFHITVGEGRIAVCNGELIGSSVNKNDRSVTWSWSETHPIAPHLMSVAACLYSELVDATYPWIHYWVYPSQVVAAQTHFSNVHTMIDAFVSRYGPYPFDKFGYAAAPKGDMEHQTCVTHLAGTIQANHIYDWLLAHEMSHQWWGDCVSINDWRDIWLSEGFATYSEAIFQEYAYGTAAYRSYMQSSLMNPVLNSSENFPIYDPDYLWGTTVYEKGGTVLHMLRGVIGDACFFEALAQYRAAYEHGNAVTTQFQDIVESVYGQDLDWFFQEWIYGTGWPDYRYGWVGQHDAGGYRLLLAIDQTQTNGPTFAMPLQVKVTTAAGDETLNLWVDEAHEFFDVPISGSPTAVALDPDNWILNRATQMPAASVEAPDSEEPGVEGPGPDAPGVDSGPGAAVAAIRGLVVAPNPSLGHARVDFTLAREVQLRVEVFDPAGRLVRVLLDEPRGAGRASIPWDGRNARGEMAGPGAYLVRVRAGGADATGRLILLP